MGETIILILFLLTIVALILSPAIVMVRCDTETARLRSEVRRLESQCEAYKLAERTRRQRQRKQKKKGNVKVENKTTAYVDDIQNIGRQITRADAIATSRDVLYKAEEARKNMVSSE